MLDVGWIADLDAVGRHVADGSPVAADTPTVRDICSIPELCPKLRKGNRLHIPVC